MLLRALAVPAFVLCASLPANAQHQPPRTQYGWPCTGRVDPAYIRTAEATGGKVLLFKPTEAAGAAEDLLASSRHPDTVFRTAGQLDDGVHDFPIPVDSTIQSVYVFASLQCMNFVTLLQPSGEMLRTDTAGVEYHEFEAIRLFTIKSPTPGTWTVRIAGHGFVSLIVSAKADLSLNGVSFIENGVPVNGLPALGQPVRVEARIGGEPREVGFQFVSMGAERLRTVQLVPEERAAPQIYAGEVTLPETEFRLMMTGTDANGFPFERVSQHLFIAR